MYFFLCARLLLLPVRPVLSSPSSFRSSPCAFSEFRDALPVGALDLINVMIHRGLGLVNTILADAGGLVKSLVGRLDTFGETLRADQRATINFISHLDIL